MPSDRAMGAGRIFFSFWMEGIMSTLRNQFIDHMTIRGFSQKTQQAYLFAMTGLAKHYCKSPDQLDNAQIQEYLLFLIRDKQLAWTSCNVAISAFRLFYEGMLKWDKPHFFIGARPKVKKLPMLMSIEDVMRLIDAAQNEKHRALLMTIYGAGLRVSEVTKLKPCHIESERMLIRVEQAKGRKDRYTILPQRLLDQLRVYYVRFRPGSYLFYTRNRDIAMSVNTAQKVYYLAKKRAGITTGRGIHTLRHCFATHLVDQGVDIYTIKQMMGHSAIKTTFTYLHTSCRKISSVQSPLDRIAM